MEFMHNVALNGEEKAHHGSNEPGECAPMTNPMRMKNDANTKYYVLHNHIRNEHARAGDMASSSSSRIKSSHRIKIKHKIESVASASIPLGICTDHNSISFGSHSNPSNANENNIVDHGTYKMNTLEATEAFSSHIIWRIKSTLPCVVHAHTLMPLPYRIAHVCIIYDETHYVALYITSVSDEAKGTWKHKKGN